MDTQWPKDFLPEIQRRSASVRGAGRFAPETGLRRSETEAFIAAVFTRAHGARIRKFMPLLLGLRNRGGRLTAACGLRAAGGGPVFLEHYLAVPVEQAVAATAAVPVARARVVEVGNLAVAPPGSARELIAALTEYLVADAVRVGGLHRRTGPAQRLPPPRRATRASRPRAHRGPSRRRARPLGHVLRQRPDRLRGRGRSRARRARAARAGTPPHLHERGPGSGRASRGGRAGPRCAARRARGAHVRGAGRRDRARAPPARPRAAPRARDCGGQLARVGGARSRRIGRGHSGRAAAGVLLARAAAPRAPRCRRGSARDRRAGALRGPGCRARMGHRRDAAAGDSHRRRARPSAGADREGHLHLRDDRRARRASASTRDALETVAQSLAGACALSAADRHLAGLPLATLLENVGGVYAPLLGGGSRARSRRSTRSACRARPASTRVRSSPRWTGTRPTTVILVPQMLRGAGRRRASAARRAGQPALRGGRRRHGVAAAASSAPTRSACPSTKATACRSARRSSRSTPPRHAGAGASGGRCRTRA